MCRLTHKDYARQEQRDATHGQKAISESPARAHDLWPLVSQCTKVMQGLHGEQTRSSHANGRKQGKCLLDSHDILLFHLHIECKWMCLVPPLRTSLLISKLKIKSEILKKNEVAK